MGALAKILIVDLTVSLGFLALAKFAPGVRAKLDEQAQALATDLVHAVDVEAAP
jgi:hypothetical protein